MGGPLTIEVLECGEKFAIPEHLYDDIALSAVPLNEAAGRRQAFALVEKAKRDAEDATTEADLATPIEALGPDGDENPGDENPGDDTPEGVQSSFPPLPIHDP